MLTIIVYTLEVSLHGLKSPKIDRTHQTQRRIDPQCLKLDRTNKTY